MKQIFSRAEGGSGTSGLELHVIWDVDADATYDVKRAMMGIQDERGGMEPPPGRLIALRTLAGSGRVYLSSGEVFETPSATLLVLEERVIRRYHCRGGRWIFWWFEFSPAGPPPLPVRHMLKAPLEPEEEAAFQEVFGGLRRPERTWRRLASAGFLRMLHRWAAQMQSSERGDPAHEVIAAIIDQMYPRLAERWTVREMARSAGMSERGFRQAFQRVTGQAPKIFYDRLRLAMADELLRQGLKRVGEVADELGFSSAFHFSRAYRRQYGFPPSRVASALRESGAYRKAGK